EKRRPPLTTLATRLIVITRSSYCPSPLCRRSLELKSCLPGCVGQGCHPAVVSEAAPVEHDLRHAGSLRPLSEELADLLGGVAVTAAGALQTLLDGAGRGKGATADVVDDLGADVLVRPEHGEARSIGGTGHVLAHTAV